MTILLVDIGNTYTKAKLDNSSCIFRLETSKILDKDYLKNNLPKEYKYDFGIISSVSIGKDKIFKDYFDSLGIPSLIINNDLNFGIKYPKINELGADLMCLMEGCLKYSDTFITISLGTASVFLYVEDKVFKGCAIAPGLLSSMDGLINTASMIENTELSGDYELLGFDTKSSVRDGLLMGHTFMIDGYIDAIKKEYKLNNPKVLMLGGFSNTLVKNLSNDVTIDQDLIFDGMMKIFKLNERVK